VSAKKAVSTYSQALFELAFEDWLEELQAAWKNLEEDAETVVAVDDSSVPFEERKARLDAHLPDNLSAKTRNFLYLLASNNDLHLLNDIIREFDNIVRGQKARRQLAQVTSAVPLTKEEQQSLETTLGKRFGADLLFRYDVDPSVLGGIRVRIGDRVIDGTVAKKIEALKEQLGVSAS